MAFPGQKRFNPQAPDADPTQQVEVMSGVRPQVRQSTAAPQTEDPSLQIQPDAQAAPDNPRRFAPAPPVEETQATTPGPTAQLQPPPFPNNLRPQVSQSVGSPGEASYRRFYPKDTEISSSSQPEQAPYRPSEVPNKLDPPPIAALPQGGPTPFSLPSLPPVDSQTSTDMDQVRQDQARIRQIGTDLNTNAQRQALSPDMIHDARTRAATAQPEDFVGPTQAMGMTDKQKLAAQEPDTHPSKKRRFGAIMAGVAEGLLTKNPMAGVAAYKDIAGEPEFLRKQRLGDEAAGLEAEGKSLEGAGKLGQTLENYSKLPAERAVAEADILKAQSSRITVKDAKGTNGETILQAWDSLSGQPVGKPFSIPGSGDPTYQMPENMKDKYASLLRRYPDGNVPKPLLDALVEDMKSQRATGANDELIRRETAAKTIAQKYKLPVDPSKPVYPQIEAMDPKYSSEAQQEAAKDKRDPVLDQMAGENARLRKEAGERQKKELEIAQAREARLQGKQTNLYYDKAIDADARLGLMQSAAGSDFKGTGDGQDDYQLLFNHIGMTLGAQKGARITADSIKDAIRARSLPQDILAMLDKVANGHFLTESERRDMIKNALDVRSREWSTSRRTARLAHVAEEPEQDPSLPPIDSLGQPKGNAAPAATPAAAAPPPANDLIWVQIPGQKPGQIHPAQWENFLKQHPNATKVAPPK